jgi:hypothetical protein
MVKVIIFPAIFILSLQHGFLQARHPYSSGSVNYQKRISMWNPGKREHIST